MAAFRFVILVANVVRLHNLGEPPGAIAHSAIISPGRNPEKPFKESYELRSGGAFHAGAAGPMYPTCNTPLNRIRGRFAKTHLPDHPGAIRSPLSALPETLLRTPLTRRNGVANTHSPYFPNQQTISICETYHQSVTKSHESLRPDFLRKWWEEASYWTP